MNSGQSVSLLRLGYLDAALSDYLLLLNVFGYL